MKSFSLLWANHPNIKDDDPIFDKKTYENQCAINLSAALLRSGVSLSGYAGNYTPQKSGFKYARGAQDMANWLSKPGAPFGKPEKYSGRDFIEKIKGRSGIIFLRNYWGTQRDGDHIDLYNGSRFTTLSSWLRLNLYISYEGIWTDYRKAESVLFWPVQ